jgi:TPR repeat protein
VPATARFCPKCGAALGAEAVDRADVLRQMEVGLGPRRDAHAHSAMIDGYAAALYQLGQRYEVGVGPNSAEAVRCYLKAARLGNLPALGRLAAACVERERPAEVDGVEPESRGEKTPA